VRKALRANRGAFFVASVQDGPDNAAMTLSAQLTHFGVHATDLDRMVDFYTRVMGFVISDQGTGRSGARVVFMTQNPECHHQFVLFDGKPADLSYNPVNQISYRLDSLDTLKGYRRTLIKEGITEHRVTDHGNAWALYFKDPEGNPVELYVDSPFYTPQPCGEPLDLDQSNDEILARTEAMCRSRPRFMTREAWMNQIQERLDARG
jgi:catechol 2,3-dioxygenase-like lactoylglutathione lyase family enzyme